jgi:hypothetical protein
MIQQLTLRPLSSQWRHDLWEAALHETCMLQSYNGFSGVAAVPLGECLPVGLL